MREIIIFICLALGAEAKLEGFYCDVFQDEGTQIGGSDMKKNCDYIGYTMEHLNISQNNSTNRKKQLEVIEKCDHDDNGYLLYPDNQPRFAIIYYHGGSMSHSRDLGEEGRKRIRTHYYNGGSQFGSCAGSYMLATYFRGRYQETYFRIWKGGMDGPNVSRTPINKIINASSPFIGYMDFKAGDVVKSVFHNNGGSVDTTEMPEGTRICAMHNSSSLKGYGAIWAWKDNDTTGRVLGITGHPEGNSSTDQKRYMGACMLYITDHLGKPKVKGTLSNGGIVEMTKGTKDDDPLRTKIGDKQYHHFTLECETAKNVEITVAGEEGYDFHVFVAKDTAAFRGNAEYADSSSGHAKKLTIPILESGKWYVGVKLNNTVSTSSGTLFPKYTGDLKMLNGISYTIEAKWEAVGIFAGKKEAIRNQFAVKLLTRNRVSIDVGDIVVSQLQVYNAQGRLCWTPEVSKKATQYTWRPKGAGMYIVRLVSGKDIFTRPLTIVK